MRSFWPGEASAWAGFIKGLKILHPYTPTYILADCIWAMIMRLRLLFGLGSLSLHARILGIEASASMAIDLWACVGSETQ